MPATIDQVTHEALLLSIVEQARLARALLDSLAMAAVGQARQEATPRRRHELMQRFVSGEWGVELSGYEQARAEDRAVAKARLKAEND